MLVDLCASLLASRCWLFSADEDDANPKHGNLGRLHGMVCMHFGGGCRTHCLTQMWGYFLRVADTSGRRGAAFTVEGW